MTQSQAELSRAIEVSFSWPTLDSEAWPESAFAGVFHPNRPIRLRIEGAGGGGRRRVLEGSNWALIGTPSALHAADAGLIHAARQGAIAFRGYVLQPAIHSHSSSEQVVRYWNSRHERTHNGVFATAMVSEDARSLTLMVDALGLGSLYYREHRGALLFATNPRLLAVEGDEPDYLAWRCLMECGFLPSNRTLTVGVHRVAPGSAVTSDADGVAVAPWFDWNRFPRGERPVDDRAEAEVEETFQKAVSRCLELGNGDLILPLSSGHDSRRILSSLMHQEAPFCSYTVRVLQKGYRDLDATFAGQMARDFGFENEVIEFAEPDRFVSDDALRRDLVDYETDSHTWVVRFAEGIPERPSVVLDGILGDVLGNPGFRMSGMYRSTEEDFRLIAAELLRGTHNRFLSDGIWPSCAEVRDELERFMAPWMDRVNMAEFAFILHRQRRSTSLQFQQNLPAGHLSVSPYADLDYLSLCFDLRPADKHRVVLQRRCLERFWPRYARYGGNRSIPSEMPSGDAGQHRSVDDALDRDIRGRLGRSGLGRARGLLSLRGRIALGMSSWSRAAARRCSWFLHPPMRLALRERNRGGAWNFAAD